jgi:hypothetical protein
MKPMMMLSAVYAAAFGIFLVLGSGLLMPPSDAFAAQLGGAGLAGMAVLNWSARNTKEREAFVPIALANLVYSAIAFIVTLLGELSGAAGGFRWSIVIIYLLFALGFAYYLFRKPSPS